MATLEHRVKEAIKKILTANHVYYAMPIGTGYGKSGVPDFLCCVSSHFLAIEAKAGNGTTTALQDRELGFIRAAGGTALIINENNIHELNNYIVLLKQRGPGAST